MGWALGVTAAVGWVAALWLIYGLCRAAAKKDPKPLDRKKR